MPRLAAFSLGILMFVTSTLVNEGRVKGSDLQAKFHDDHWEYCRATDMEADGMNGVWFSRLLRRPPAVSEGYKCFGAAFWAGTSIPHVIPFNSTEFLDDNGTPHSNAAIPRNNGTFMPSSAGFPMDKLESLHIFNTSDFPQFTFHCMYQCAKWKTVGLMALIKNVGSIVAGSAVVIKTTDGISKNFGGYWCRRRGGGGCMFGLPLVTQDTPAKELEEIVAKTVSRPGKGRSKLFAAFVCLLATSPLRFASKLDMDGYYTVDYYVTAVFLSSLLVALIVRQWNPYKVMRIAYTEKMWLNGEDKFIDFKKHTHRSIDLYEWIHLTQESRSQHLMGYARMVTVKAVTKEMDTQKAIHDMEKSLKNYNEPATDEERDQINSIKEKLDKSKKQLAKEQKEAAQGGDNVMLEEYYNRNATLMVKSIKAMAVITPSPPVTGAGTAGFNTSEGQAVPSGSILHKNVVLREGAIGTILEKVNDAHIKVRFPKNKPQNAPLLNARSDAQYQLEFQPALQDGHELTVSRWMKMAEKELKNRLQKPDIDDVEELADGGGQLEEEHSADDLDNFEDVVVSLEQVLECSHEWLNTELKKRDWEQRWKQEQEQLKEQERKDRTSQSADP